MPPSSLDCNPLDFFVCSVVEAGVNKTDRNNVGDLKAAIMEEMHGLVRRALFRAWSSFRPRLEQVVWAEGGIFE